MIYASKANNDVSTRAVPGETGYGWTLSIEFRTGSSVEGKLELRCAWFKMTLIFSLAVLSTVLLYEGMIEP